MILSELTSALIITLPRHVYSYRLILIAERDKVYEEFPTPLINRLEKHFVVTATVLNETQKQLLKDVENWVKKYACIRLA